MLNRVSFRNRLGFLILGLTNNFSYVIMLSAAKDLLDQPSKSYTNFSYENTNSTLKSNQSKAYCNEVSTSTILLADTVPSLGIKLIYPFLLVGLATRYKAFSTAFLSLAAFLITGNTNAIELTFLGVICAALSSGLGETTFLSNTTQYGDSSLGGWAIGTGAAGLVGSMAYALLTSLHLSTQTIMNMMVIVPVVMLIAYGFMIVPVSECQGQDESESVGHPLSFTKPISSGQCDSDQTDQASRPIMSREGQSSPPIKNYGLRRQDRVGGDTDEQVDNFGLVEKLKYLPKLRNYLLPLMLVYFAEYLINQGLFELIFYQDVNVFYKLPLDKNAQYRWFQVFYQIGVFISRSTIETFRIKNIWIMSVLQFINLIIVLAHVTKLISIPSFYIMISLILYEGLLGGFTYVNAFYRLKKEVEPKRREFAISTATLGDSLGIVAAGFTALPVHTAICKLYD